MRQPDDAHLRQQARDNSAEMNLRIARHQADAHECVDQRLDAAARRLDELEKRTAEVEHVLHIERDEFPDIVGDALTSGDDGVLWNEMDQRRIRPKTTIELVKRFKAP